MAIVSSYIFINEYAGNLDRNIPRGIVNSMLRHNMPTRCSLFWIFVILAILLPAPRCSAATGYLYSEYLDPLDAGIGARANGMGRAFVAAADDVNSIFYNPAGLSFAKSTGYTLGGSSTVNDSNVSNFGVYWAGSDEAIGIGIAGYNSWIPLTLPPSREPATSRNITIEPAPLGHTESVAMLSYGVKLGKYFGLPIIDKTSFGFSIKGFFENIVASQEIIRANGFNMDAGLIYTANSWFKLGLFGQNLLDDASGGKLIWLAENGYMEPILPTYKAGISTKILGSGGMIETGQTLMFNFEAEDSKAYKNIPITYRGGLEWLPWNFMALRFGVDQIPIIPIDTKEFDIESDYTGGIGFVFGDLGIDYSYHRYGDVIDDTRQYLSVSYVLPLAITEAPVVTEEAAVVVTKEVASTPEATPKEEYLRVLSPADRSIVYTGSAILNFEVINPKVFQVELMGTKIDVSGEAQKSIVRNINLPATGKWQINIKCLDSAGLLLKEYNIRLARLPVFKDVPESHWARESISIIAALGLITGYPDGNFKPSKTITRAEISSILAKASGFMTPEATITGFKDVGQKSWAAYYIKSCADLGYVLGYPDGRFMPNAPVTRAEGVSIISRFARITPMEEMDFAPFPDVPVTHWAAKIIYTAKYEGLLTYMGEKPFGPNKNITRAEVAAILAQTKYAKDRVKEFYDNN